jgi:hypothetical protein
LHSPERTEKDAFRKKVTNGSDRSLGKKYTRGSSLHDDPQFRDRIDTGSRSHQLDAKSPGTNRSAVFHGLDVSAKNAKSAHTKRQQSLLAAAARARESASQPNRRAYSHSVADLRPVGRQLRTNKGSSSDSDKASSRHSSGVSPAV